MTGGRLEENRRAAQFAITRVLSEAPSLEAAAPRLLGVLCEKLGWEVGELWTLDPGAQALWRVTFWHAASLDVPDFEASGRTMAFAAGGGLPGRVWARREAVWIPDVAQDDHFPRAAIARRSGLHAGCGFPVTDGDVFLGALALFSRSIRAPDEALLPVMADIGAQIGAFIGRRRSERSFQEAQARYRDLVESVQAIVCRADPATLQFTFVSPQAEKLLGYPLKRWVEAPGFWTEHIHPEDRDRTVSRALEAIGENRDHQFEYRMRAADGRVVWINHSVRVHVEDHRPTELISFMVDVTERKRLEEQDAVLRKTLGVVAAEWQETVDSIDSPMLLLDARSHVRRLNRAARDLAGGSYGDTLGRHVASIGSGEPWRRAGELVEVARDSRSSVSAQVHEGPGRRSWDIAATPSLVSDDERLILTIRDITPIVELQESLRRGERMAAMGALMAGVAHEVRNPLFSISANLDVLEGEIAERSPHDDTLGIIRSELTRLSRLMEELLDYGRPTRVERSPEGVADVVGQAADACAFLSRQSKVKVVNRVRRDLPAVPMDRPRLVQVFQNLLENAIQHSPKRGAVTASGAEVGREGRRWVECAIDDSGPGFEQGDAQRLFEPFFTRRPGGTGLGLSIVQKIVDEHGGTVGALNRRQGGARFVVRLPCDGPVAPQEAP